MKVPRNRAWRRRKARLFLSQIAKTRDWLFGQFNDPEIKAFSKEEKKRHKAGKLTKRQELRNSFAVQTELTEGLQP